MVTKVTLKGSGLEAVAQAAFPTYRGRIFKRSPADRPIDVRSYWDGGSRSYFTFVRLSDLAAMTMPPQSAYDRPVTGADAVQVPEGFILVERSYFCGKDRGLTFHVPPANLNARMLQAEVR